MPDWQWCCPFFLQQAGTRDADSAAEARSGERRGRPKTASNRTERIFRTWLGVEHLWPRSARDSCVVRMGDGRMWRDA